MLKLKLTEYEQSMLDGKFGRFKQAAMENIVKYANALGAEELCTVTKAHCCCGVPPVGFGHADTHEESFSKTYFYGKELIPIDKISDECFMQTDISSCDFIDYKPMNHMKEMFDLNMDYLHKDVEMGITIMGSCTPYLTGWLPLRGEHFVTSESSNVLMCNSVFSACGNADGQEAVLWSAITGRTPKWGNHIPQNRYATTVFNVNFPLNTRMDWDVLGFAVGSKLKLNAIPVIVPMCEMENPSMAKLKQLFATMATSSGAEMCHIVGITPEAPTLKAALGEKEPIETIEITIEDYQYALNDFCDKGSGDIQFVSLGCPHYTMEELSHVARTLRNKKINDKVNLIIWTDHTTKEAARLSGYIDWIEAANGHVLSSGCPVVQGPECYDGVSALLVDAGKQAHYMHSSTNAKIFYGTTDECIEAAINARWEEKKR